MPRGASGQRVPATPEAEAPSRLRTKFLFTLEVIRFGLFIQISLQKCENGLFFQLFPRKQDKM